MRKWCLDPESEGTRTAVIRIDDSVETAAAVDRFKERGIKLQSAGPGAIVAVVTAGALRELADLEWVVAVEEPRRLFTRAPGMK